VVINISRHLVSIFGFLDVLKFAMDEHPETIMIGFAPADFLTAVVAPALIESIKESWDTPVFDLAEKAKDKGLKGVNEFLLTSGTSEKKYGFNVLDIDQIVLNKLLKGEINTLKELRDLKFTERQSDSSPIYTIFFTEIYNEEVEKYITTIDCIFINS